MEQEIEEKAKDCDRGRNSLPSVDPRATLHPRRGFLKNVAGVAAGAFAAGLAGLPSRRALAKEPHTNPGQPTQAGGLSADNRLKESFDTRVAAAKIARSRPLVRHQSNNDEVNFPTMIGNYSKGLPHNNKGEVILSAYNKMLKALNSGDPADFERIPLDLGRKLTSPQAGLAFDLEGPDSHHESIPPAPRIDSALLASEGAELYWMALARDVSFLDYGTDPTIAAAAADLSGFSDFNGPKEGGAVTPNTIFRGFTTGDLIGPYISQFMYFPVPYGPQEITQRNATVLAGRDYMTDFATWLSVQRGSDPSGTDQVDSVPRFLRNLRDLTAYVHMDALYQAYLNACLILLRMGAPTDDGLPPNSSATQIGFVEFGGPHILSLVTEVATRALKAVWFQKWFVHRELRPEAFGGRVHNQKTGAANYPLNNELLDSPVLDEVFSRHGSYLLPQAYPEGCPTHPSYGSGHATVAGACVTILKAWFDEDFVLPDPVIPNADGTDLVPYVGSPLTVRNELNKVAANVAQGRNAAGIHWRHDYAESLKLGEAVALGILEEQKITYNQEFSLTLTKFDGTQVVV